ncbi:unnamed protein product [Prorocentrum cordatum]|uniref:EF-hand domain-containing protein n=1 Tax=Prorocentrum cordatum TaxID=2364126 RepID=A0ABN9XD83_9DINO|nr:unnamed protein product [Polarella glacialis]
MLLQCRHPATGRSPLHVAARHGRAELCSLLLRWRADAHAEELNGATPLALAALHRHAGTAKLLVAWRAAPGATDFRGRNALHLACCVGDLDVLCLLHAAAPEAVHAVDDEGHTALHYAVGRPGTVRNEQVVEKLMEWQCDPSLEGQDGFSTVRFATETIRDPATSMMLAEHRGSPAGQTAAAADPLLAPLSGGAGPEDAAAASTTAAELHRLREAWADQQEAIARLERQLRERGDSGQASARDGSAAADFSSQPEPAGTAAVASAPADRSSSTAAEAISAAAPSGPCGDMVRAAAGELADSVLATTTAAASVPVDALVGTAARAPEVPLALASVTTPDAAALEPASITLAHAAVAAKVPAGGPLDEVAPPAPLGTIPTPEASAATAPAGSTLDAAAAPASVRIATAPVVEAARANALASIDSESTVVKAVSAPTSGTPDAPASALTSTAIPEVSAPASSTADAASLALASTTPYPAAKVSASSITPDVAALAPASITLAPAVEAAKAPVGEPLDAAAPLDPVGTTPATSAAAATAASAPAGSALDAAATTAPASSTPAPAVELASALEGTTPDATLLALVSTLPASAVEEASAPRSSPDAVLAQAPASTTPTPAPATPASALVDGNAAAAADVPVPASTTAAPAAAAPPVDRTTGSVAAAATAAVAARRWRGRVAPASLVALSVKELGAELDDIHSKHPYIVGAGQEHPLRCWLERAREAVGRGEAEAAGELLQKVRDGISIEASRIQCAFDHFDTDGSGTVDASEFGHMCACLGLDNDLNDADLDANGTVSFKELQRFVGERGGLQRLLARRRGAVAAGRAGADGVFVGARVLAAHPGRTSGAAFGRRAVGGR